MLRRIATRVASAPRGGLKRWGSDAANPHVIIDLCVVPMKHTDGVSVSKEVCLVEKLIDESGLTHKMHAYGTNIEGPWDDVFALVKQCHVMLHNEHGVPRITTTIKAGTRTDKHATIANKIQSVEDKMGVPS
eukprot:TRINITY_DN2675_c0_g1_i1.p1 TRINITY_DN2675_c0_g1~~TRINITY_DN2675_c0_g1_i1.p1  ORF type:complete len:132 (+),score=51.97 TRINITY_DN2675_c0_g1_i1:90-485(+)